MATGSDQGPSSPSDQRHTATLVAVTSAWKGPLPSPDDLEQYGKIVEGGAEIIFD